MPLGYVHLRAELGMPLTVEARSIASVKTSPETRALAADIAGIGTLAVGIHADVILLSLPDVEGVPSGHPLADVLLWRGRGEEALLAFVTELVVLSARYRVERLRVCFWMLNGCAVRDAHSGVRLA